MTTNIIVEQSINEEHTYNNEKYIYFHNNTPLPIMLSSWVDNSSQMLDIKIEAGEKRIIHSSVGEWHLDSMFQNRIDQDQWNEYFGKDSIGLSKYVLVGKFRSKPDYFGNYSYMENDEPFQCKYSTLETNDYIQGLITYSLIDSTNYILK